MSGCVLRENATHLLPWVHQESCPYSAPELGFFFSAIRNILILVLIKTNWNQWKDLNQTWNLLSWNSFAELPGKNVVKQGDRKVLWFCFSSSSSWSLSPTRVWSSWAAGAMRELSRVQWGRSKNVSLWACLALCILLCRLPLTAVFKVLHAQGTSYGFPFVPRIFLESEYPKRVRVCYNNAWFLFSLLVWNFFSLCPKY